MNEAAHTASPVADTAELALSGGSMRFSRSRVFEPDSSLFDPLNPDLQASAVAVGGRQSAWFVSGSFGRAVLRHYRRGGLVARISRNRYVWTGAQTTRSFAEYELLQYMHSRGLSVPRPLAAAYWRSGIFYRAAILVSLIPDARTLARSLDSASQTAVAEAILAMHEAGVWHADLNAYNILLDRDERVWLIDFDRSRRLPITARHRQSNLLRLRRSLIKVAGERGLTYWHTINRAYDKLLKEKRGI